MFKQHAALHSIVSITNVQSWRVHTQSPAYYVIWWHYFINDKIIIYAIGLASCITWCDRFCSSGMIRFHIVYSISNETRYVQIIVYCQATYFSSRRWYGIPGWVCRGPQDVTTEAILSPQLDILLCLTITQGWVTPPSTILLFKVKDNDIQIILWHLIFVVFQYVFCWRDNCKKRNFII